MNVRYDRHDFKLREDDLRAAFERVLAGAGGRRALRLFNQIDDLEGLLRAVANRGGDAAACARATEAWLSAEVAEVDDPLRRATTAALVLAASRQADLPICMLALYPDTHERLARFLEGPHTYDQGRFAADLALATGSAASVGALTVTIPPARGGLQRRARHAAGAAFRAFVQHGPGSAIRWLTDFGVGPLAELHVDTRNLRDFNREGFYRCYRRLAALLDLRPDIVGIYGASWIYDPQLAVVSPSLSFARETAAEGGGRFVRLRTDPVQVQYALTRSATRRRLHESGRYDPVCYGMYWARRSLIGWTERSSEGQI